MTNSTIQTQNQNNFAKINQIMTSPEYINYSIKQDRARYVAKRVKEIRELKGYTQEKLAQLMGVNQVFVAQLESAKKSPSLSTIDKFCLATGAEFSLNL